MVSLGHNVLIYVSVNLCEEDNDSNVQVMIT